MGDYTNADGLLIREAPYNVTTGLTRDYSEGIESYLVVDFEYDNLPDFDLDAGGGSTPDSFSSAVGFVPAGSYVTKATLICGTDWATADSADLTLGFYKKDGSAIDSDGIDAAIASTALDLGDVVLCDGTLVGGTVYVGADDAYIVGAIATGTFTTGAARLIVQYVASA